MTAAKRLARVASAVLLGALGFAMACGSSKSSTTPGGNGGSAGLGFGGNSGTGNNNGGSSAASGTGGATDTTICTTETSGAFRCSGAQLEICDPTTTTGWLPAASCSAPENCDAANGRCRICTPGANRCEGWKLESCNARGDGWDLTDQCATSAYCDAGQGKCVDCLPDEAFCSEQYLNSCNATQDGWDVTICDSADLCNAASESCRPCLPGELQCNGTELLQCDDNATWQHFDDCATAALCTATVTQFPSTDTAGWTGACVPPVCQSGEYRCSPADASVLEGCPPSQDRWERLEACRTSALCDAEAGVCQIGCDAAPGTLRCLGAELQRCNLDGTAFETFQTCDSPANCNVVHGYCTPCVPGEVQCNGAELQQCDDNVLWQHVADCATGALCSTENGGQCIPPICVAGAYDCQGADGRTLVQCNLDRNGYSAIDTCVTPELCDAENGHCIASGCPEGGAVDCINNVLVSCPDSQVDWDQIQNCSATGQLCDAANQRCTDECPDPPFQCRDNGTPEQCVVDPDTGTLSWVAVRAPCVTPGLCYSNADGAGCNDPICDAGQYQCNGQELQSCETNRTGWTTEQLCGDGEICDALGEQCDLCQANIYSCVGNQLDQCSSNGQTISTVTNCRDAAHCFTADGGTTGNCYVCDAGEQQCFGANQIQKCAADRLSWAAPANCLNGCVNAPGYAAYCAACPTAGEVQCVTTAAPGSTHQCNSDRSAWGTTTECSQGYGCVVVDPGDDYCAGTCVPNQASCVTSTSTHTCNANGQGYSATVSECADTTHLKGCTDGVLGGSVACTSVGDGTKPYCVIGACVACTGTTSQCVDNDTRQYCSSNAWVTENCTNDNPICVDGVCGQTCTSDPQCATAYPSKPYCVDNACVECAPGTTRCSSTTAQETCLLTGTWPTTGTTCSQAKPICADNACRVCLSSDECGNAYSTRPICSDGACVQCSANTDCSGTTPICLDGSCEGCTDDTECANAYPSTPVCSGGACVECTADADCTSNPNGTHCSSVNTCVECKANLDCPDDAPVCSSNNQCGQCATSSDCVGRGSLAVCDTENGACVECAQTSDCGDASLMCSNNECVAAGTGGAAGSGGATSGGATSGGATSGGATSGGATSGGATSGGATSGGATSGGATSNATMDLAPSSMPIFSPVGAPSFTTTEAFPSNASGVGGASSLGSGTPLDGAMGAGGASGL